MDQAIRAYAQGVAKTRNRVARNVRKPDAESRSLVQHAKDGSQLRKGLWIILAICTERLVVEIKPEDRDMLIATARASEQQVAELRYTQDTLVMALQGMVGLVELICAASAPDYRATIEANHRLIAARAALEKVGK